MNGKSEAVSFLSDMSSENSESFVQPAKCLLQPAAEGPAVSITD